MNWDEVFKTEASKPYYKDLMRFIDDEYQNQTVYPPRDEIFTAFLLTPFDNVNVVILGQDPYHDFNQAHGLAFSIPKEQTTLPPSLKNIFKELQDDCTLQAPEHGNLVSWARQGVLLLNTVLTVRAHEANSHKNKGWEIFTDRIIERLGKRDRPIVFMLWGNEARKKKQMIDNPQHFILESAHPSPLSAYRGFLGCKHFSRANQFLMTHNQSAIDWKV